MEDTKQEVVRNFRMRSIRDATSRVVSRHGVAGATIDAIASEAGIAKGTIYLYFKSREELLNHAADYAVTELMEQVQGVIGSSEPFDVQLRRFFRTVLTYFDEHGEFFRLYQAACTQQGGGRSVRYGSYLDRIREWVAGAMAAGQVRRLDVDRVTLVITESLSAVVRRRLLETGPTLEDDAEWLASLYLHGLIPGKGTN
ncbi:MAG: TetR/AcrR family transcriptional regulator [Thermoanaerobaculia bacterium]